MAQAVVKDAAVKPQQRYLVTAANPDYNDVTAGVQFNRGRAVIDPLTLDASLNRTTDEVAKILRDLGGYTVEPID